MPGGRISPCGPREFSYRVQPRPGGRLPSPRFSGPGGTGRVGSRGLGPDVGHREHAVARLHRFSGLRAPRGRGGAPPFGRSGGGADAWWCVVGGRDPAGRRPFVGRRHWAVVRVAGGVVGRGAASLWTIRRRGPRGAARSYRLVFGSLLRRSGGG